MTGKDKAQLRRLAGHVVSATRTRSSRTPGKADQAPGEPDTPGEPDMYLFSRAGFARELVREAHPDPKCYLIDVRELFRAPRT